MAAQTEAQIEFDALISNAQKGDRITEHPSNQDDYNHDRVSDDKDEETEYLQQKIDENMRMPTLSRDVLHLPHRDFDNGRTTGVKGVIADARSYEEARRNGAWKQHGRSKSVVDNRTSFYKEDGEGSDAEDDEFIERWRQQRREELQSVGNDIRNRRTSPSVRRYGRFDEVDALGYLDAIEKVTRDTVVVVFVYDPEVSSYSPSLFTSKSLDANSLQCAVSQVISDALAPLVPTHPAIHFVRVNYEDIEFDNAGVPAILAYRNQGDLFANLTYIIDKIPEDTLFDTRTLETILRNEGIF